MPHSSSPPSPTAAFFLEHLAGESARFREVLADAPTGVRVPTCPEWDADDLLWHLGEVQWFWGEIAERGLTTGQQVEAMNADRDPRPADRDGLLAFYDRSSERLHRVLSGLAPQTELWMWADDHSAAYIVRRQAHEALIHRLDAELTVGAHSPLDAALAADGVDEALNVMRGHADDPGEPGIRSEPIAGAVVLSAVDTMHSWTVRPLRVFGTDNDGDELDELAFGVEQGAQPGVSTQIQGTASDLDSWLWNRPTSGQTHPARRRGHPRRRRPGGRRLPGLTPTRSPKMSAVPR